VIRLGVPAGPSLSTIPIHPFSLENTTLQQGFIKPTNQKKH